MSLEMGLIYAMLIMVLGACFLTAFAIYLRTHGAEAGVARTARQFTAVIERCADTGLYVGHVPGIAGAHTQAATLDEVNENLREVLEMLLEDGVEPESEFIGTQLVSVPQPLA